MNWQVSPKPEGSLLIGLEPPQRVVSFWYPLKSNPKGSLRRHPYIFQLVLVGPYPRKLQNSIHARSTHLVYPAQTYSEAAVNVALSHLPCTLVACSVARKQSQRLDLGASLGANCVKGWVATNVAQTCQLSRGLATSEHDLSDWQKTPHDTGIRFQSRA